MAFESLTDETIKKLINCPKLVTNPNIRIRIKDGNEQVNYKVIATDGSNNHFELYKRQNLRVGMETDFSCGLSWLAPNGEVLTLKRHNGASHNHLNSLEKEKLGFNFHIHLATEKYIKANRKPDGFAEIADSFNNLNEALNCLVIDCNIKGIDPSLI